MLTAAYLIIRTSSASFGGEISLSRLCYDKELFCLPLTVFGCVGPGLDKLAPRFLRCVFVGYSRTQKGYRCYHPPSRRYFVSVDVTFWESKSYFDSTDQPNTPITVLNPSPVEIVHIGGDQHEFRRKICFVHYRYIINDGTHIRRLRSRHHSPL